MISRDPLSSGSDDAGSTNQEFNPSPQFQKLGCAESRQAYDAEFIELLGQNSSSGRLIYAFTRRELHQFGLAGAYQEIFLLNEAYKRGVQALERGEVIRNLPAWLRGTVHRICQEEKRRQQRFVSLEEDVPGIEDHDVASEELENDLMTLGLGLQVLLQTLEPIDREILILKIVRGFQWKQIRQMLQEQGFGDHTEVTLRKRKERTLKRLRMKYHSFKPYDFPQWEDLK
jgi:DNA-directed RNA polymerase specialized sigma24 family protein